MRTLPGAGPAGPRRYERGWSDRALRKRLERARRSDWDFTRGRIFGSLCTEPAPAGRAWIDPFRNANLGNPGLCPGSSLLQEELVEELLTLYHAPREGAGGWLVSGATEANVTALWTFRNLTGGREVVLPRSAHFSFVKALDLLGLEARWVRVDAAGRMDVRQARRAIGRRTAALVGLAGSTELGAVDPLEELSELALRTGVPLHVDAAIGGFFLPFLPEEERRRLPFDFSLPGVRSLASDPHKLGRAPIPSGVLLFRNLEETRAIEVPSPYLSDPRSRGLLGTRPSFAVASTFAALRSAGWEGLREQTRRLRGLVERLLEGGKRLGLEPVTDPRLNVVAFRHPDPRVLQAELLERGWDVSLVQEPRALRLVLMPHARRSTVEGLLRELARALARHPRGRGGEEGRINPEKPPDRGSARRSGRGSSGRRSAAG